MIVWERAAAAGEGNNDVIKHIFHMIRRNMPPAVTLKGRLKHKHKSTHNTLGAAESYLHSVMTLYVNTTEIQTVENRFQNSRDAVQNMNRTKFTNLQNI